MKKAALFFLLLLCLASLASSRVLYRCANPKNIALTFDDGPSPKYTEKILDVLKKEKVKAALRQASPRQATAYPGSRL